MATSLLALLDDIATVLDDVSVMTKVAARKSAAMADDVAVLTKVSAQKTAGVLGDDLALNAQQVTDVSAQREIPVVWAVAKGSLLNKAILVPAALAISAFAPWAVTPLLMVGGAFLCFEGFEKVAHKLMHPGEQEASKLDQLKQELAQPDVDLAAMEKDKIKGAVRTDFILSAEIIAITLGTVADKPFATQFTGQTTHQIHLARTDRESVGQVDARTDPRYRAASIASRGCGMLGCADRYVPRRTGWSRHRCRADA